MWYRRADSADLLRLQWLMAHNEGDLKLKMDFARRKCSVDNVGLQDVVPLICPEIMDAQDLLRDGGEVLRCLYAQSIPRSSTASSSAAASSSSSHSSINHSNPLPCEAILHQHPQLAQTLAKLRQDIDQLSADDRPSTSLEYLLNTHKRIGPAVVLILEAQARRSGSALYLDPDAVLVYRKLRRSFLLRFFAFLLSFHLSENEAVKEAQPQHAPHSPPNRALA